MLLLLILATVATDAEEIHQASTDICPPLAAWGGTKHRSAPKLQLCSSAHRTRDTDEQKFVGLEIRAFLLDLKASKQFLDTRTKGYCSSTNAATHDNISIESHTVSIARDAIL